MITHNICFCAEIRKKKIPDSLSYLELYLRLLFYGIFVSFQMPESPLKCSCQSYRLSVEIRNKTNQMILLRVLDCLIKIKMAS